jgi:hypothetical protein
MQAAPEELGRVREPEVDDDPIWYKLVTVVLGSSVYLQDHTHHASHLSMQAAPEELLRVREPEVNEDPIRDKRVTSVLGSSVYAPSCCKEQIMQQWRRRRGTPTAAARSLLPQNLKYCVKQCFSIILAQIGEVFSGTCRIQHDAANSSNSILLAPRSACMPAGFRSKPDDED